MFFPLVDAAAFFWFAPRVVDQRKGLQEKDPGRTSWQEVGQGA